jgi:hypothetical protein
MAHDQIGHMLQEVHIIVADTVPWLVVKDTVGSDTGSTWRFDWNTSIEACMGSLFHVRTIAESLIFEKIVDDMNFAGILAVAIGSFVSFRDVDSVLTNREASAHMVSFTLLIAILTWLTVELWYCPAKVHQHVHCGVTASIRQEHIHSFGRRKTPCIASYSNEVPQAGRMP